MFYNYLSTLIISMTPILESRASIPLGYLTLGLDLWQAVLVSILGGIIVTTFLLWCLPPVIQFFLNFTIFKPIINFVLDKTRQKHATRFNLIGNILLVTLVSLPIPGSGAYVGSLVAYLFGIPFKKALTLITIGLVISAILVGLITAGASGLWSLIFN